MRGSGIYYDASIGDFLFFKPILQRLLKTHLNTYNIIHRINGYVCYLQFLNHKFQLLNKLNGILMIKV